MINLILRRSVYYMPMILCVVYTCIHQFSLKFCTCTPLAGVIIELYWTPGLARGNLRLDGPGATISLYTSCSSLTWFTV